MSKNASSRIIFFLLIVLSVPACAAWRNPGDGINRVKNNAEEERLREDIVYYAEKFLGSRYKYAGRSPKTGFDCSGFTHFVMNNFEIKLSPSSREQANQGKSIDLKTALPGDLIFFRRKGRINHVAMIVETDGKNIKIIHSTSRGVVVDELMKSKYWKPKIAHVRNVISS